MRQYLLINGSCGTHRFKDMYRLYNRWEDCHSAATAIIGSSPPRFDTPPALNHVIGHGDAGTAVTVMAIEAKQSECSKWCSQNHEHKKTDAIDHSQHTCKWDTEQGKCIAPAGHQ